MTKVLIFNLETDYESKVLGASIDWIKEFQVNFDEVEVVSTRIGEDTFLPNIVLNQIGGGNLLFRIRAIFLLFKIYKRNLKQKSDLFVFHHMSPRTAVFPGILFKLSGVKQGLWYSHSKKPPSLILGSRVVDKLFSSEKNSLPIFIGKEEYVGHGISREKFKASNKLPKERSGILFLGRIAPIKNLQTILVACEQNGFDSEICFIGNEYDSTFARELKETALQKHLNLKIEQPVPHAQAADIMSRYLFFYSGMQKSVDKSALEAAFSGCLVLTTDLGTLRLTGMRDAWEAKFGIVPHSIEMQLKLLMYSTSEFLLEVQEISQRCAIERNSLDRTIKRISDSLKALV